MKIKIILLIVFLILFLPKLTIAATQDLNYDNTVNQVNITYDSTNRILTKNSTGVNINYTYDDQYQGTLTNVNYGNNTINYLYDDKLQLVKETRIIDGIIFEKTYTYDSMDRLIETSVAGKEIEYYYNNQSKTNKITNYTTDSSYDAFGKILNRTYANSKVTEFVYNTTNSRLNQIKTGVIQNLNYIYDAAGNVISINDSANNRMYRMSYDFLGRLTNVSIAGNTWGYLYNSIGNMLKIIRDNQNTTKFVYGTYPVHAPSQIITVDAGVDIRSQENLYSTDRNQTVKFYLANDKNSTITAVNWTVDFGNGQISTSNVAFNISNDPILVIVGQNYSSGGIYNVNITARSNAASYDFENLTNKFGITIGLLSFINQDGNRANFNMTIINDLGSAVSGINWACDNGAKSNSSFSIASSGSRTEYFNKTYTSPGSAYLNCNVTSSQGNDTKFVKFELKGIKIEDYNSSSVAENNRSIQFNIKNYWSPTAVNWNIRSDGQFLSGITSSLGTGSTETVSQNFTYATDGAKVVNVTIFSGSMSDLYNEIIQLKALRIEDYNSVNLTNNNRLLEFSVGNYWPQNITSVTWNVSNPVLSSSNYFNLTGGEKVLVFIENNYSTQGIKKPTVLAYNGTFSESFSDRFNVKMIDILRSLVLKENKDSTVQVIEVMNNIGSQVLSWLFNSGQQTIGSNQNTTLNNSEGVIIIIETNYTTGRVYVPNITVNTTLYNDTYAIPVVA